MAVSEKDAARTKAWHEANPDRVLEYKRRYRDNNRAALNVIAKERTRAANRARLEAAAGRPAPEACEICGGPEGPRNRRMHFDHDHETGEFRGWLCARCNMTLGQVEDDIELLIKLIAYLKKARGD